jgi:predicted AAA+ superfamily ATPase
LARHFTAAGRLSFWRKCDGTEVDFVVEHGRRILAVEVKAKNNPGYADIAGLLAFLDENPSAMAGLLLHKGNAIKRLGEKILAVPWSMLTG